MMNTSEPRPPRMYSDAERNAIPRELWVQSHWIDWVEAGASRSERRRRLAQVPDWAIDMVRERCERRTARAWREAGLDQPEAAHE